MEEMNNQVIENGTTEIVEEVAEKVTLGQNIGAYALAGTFVMGVATIGYLSYKGITKLADKIKSKRVKTVESEDKVVDIEEEDIHEVKDDESEQN